MRPFAGNGTSFHVVTFYHLKASWFLLRACRGKKVFGFFALLVSLSPFPFSFPSPFSCPFSVLLYTVVLLELDLELSSTLTWKFTLLSARYPEFSLPYAQHGSSSFDKCAHKDHPHGELLILLFYTLCSPPSFPYDHSAQLKCFECRAQRVVLTVGYDTRNIWIESPLCCL